MLSAAKHLVLRPFAEFILSEAEGLRVTHKCANLVWFDLVILLGSWFCHLTIRSGAASPGATG
jgi:hypothetical protein